MKMTDFFLLLFAGLALIVAGMHLAPAHWQHVFGVAFKVVIFMAGVFLVMLLLALGGQAEKKKLEELLAELEAQSQQEEIPEAATPATSTTGTGEEEDLQTLYRKDANTGEERKITASRWERRLVELEIKTDE